MLFPTTIAGSLPKPEWLARAQHALGPLEIQRRRARPRQARRHHAGGEAAGGCQGVDTVTEGEQARQHFVHGFLEKVEGIDFAHKVEMGIRKDRYKAMVPQVISAADAQGPRPCR